MIKKVERTSTTAWSPVEYEEPLLALGTVAGAMDASFSSKTELEIFNLDLSTPNRTMKRVGGIACNARFNRISWGKSVIACGKENGEIDLYDPKRILAGDAKALTKRSLNHSGPVRGLHFNPTDHHLLASGGTDGEILIWDMNDIEKPFAPGARSQRMEDVTTLVWNKEVPHILASGSSNGYTVVWDLRNRKEIIKIANPGGRRPITSIAWNPEKATQMVTCSDDDANPVIMVWDLRNASAAEMNMFGHSKGILSLDWCPKDSDLLLSCGKDNRTIVWDTTIGEQIGDLAYNSNWAFDAKWYPRNPDLCVVSSFDGTVSVHSIQGGGDYKDEPSNSPIAHHEADPVADPNDPFAQITHQEHTHEVQQPVFALRKPPKWLRRPVGASWGFGASLVSFNAANGPVVNTKQVPLNEELVFRADQLEYIFAEGNSQTSAEYCDYMANSEFLQDEADRDIWKFMKLLFSPNMQQELVDFLGFDPNFESDAKMSKLLKKMTLQSGSPASAANKSPSLTPEGQPPQTNPVAFSLYSSKVGEDNDIDTLITKTLIHGDFETAVNICLGANRLADALAIAVTAGGDLVSRTQQEFLKRTISTKSYSRVLQGIVSGDLVDLINNCRLDGKNTWKELLGLICTFGNVEDFTYYFSLLGDRLSGLPGNKDAKQAASLCYLGSGNFESVVSTWMANEGSPKVSRDLRLQNIIEKVSVFRQAIHFQDPRLSLDHSEGDFSLRSLYDAYVEYASIAEANGKVETAWRFLEQVPVDFIPSNTACDIFVLRDRVYTNKGLALAVTGGPPTFPFQRVDVIDYEAIKRAEEQQRIYEEQARAEQLLQQQRLQQQQQQQNLSQQQYQNYGQNAQNQYNQYNSGYQPNMPNGPTSQNQWNQPPANQWNQQPPANQWQQPQELPQPVNQWNQPQNNQWNQPPPVNQWSGTGLKSPAIGATGYASNAPVQPFQPPSNIMPNSFQPPAPHQFPRRESFTSPSLSQASAPPPATNHVRAPETFNIISPAEKACYEKLQKHWSRYAENSKTPQDRRSFEEAEKKMVVLYEQMSQQRASPQIINELNQISAALDRDDFATAKKVEHQLRTAHFNESGSWIVGIKRMVEGLEKFAHPVGNLQPPFQSGRSNSVFSDGFNSQNNNMTHQPIPPMPSVPKPQVGPPPIFNPNIAPPPASQSQFPPSAIPSAGQFNRPPIPSPFSPPPQMQSGLPIGQPAAQPSAVQQQLAPPPVVPSPFGNVRAPSQPSVLQSPFSPPVPAQPSFGQQQPPPVFQVTPQTQAQLGPPPFGQQQQQGPPPIGQPQQSPAPPQIGQPRQSLAPPPISQQQGQFAPPPVGQQQPNQLAPPPIVPARSSSFVGNGPVSPNPRPQQSLGPPPIPQQTMGPPPVGQMPPRLPGTSPKPALQPPPMTRPPTQFSPQPGTQAAGFQSNGFNSPQPNAMQPPPIGRPPFQRPPPPSGPYGY